MSSRIDRCNRPMRSVSYFPRSQRANEVLAAMISELELDPESAQISDEASRLVVTSKQEEDGSFVPVSIAEVIISIDNITSVKPLGGCACALARRSQENIAAEFEKELEAASAY